ncbi:hypothetical protein [Hyalangium rubrum]|uniref:Amine oxidase n=1 Tax=Hyalangium rubrum TaxID=3103134 RepID=A0ABU5H5L7_9BACT|nr:hypothetical protein [Hyalangium sp. s54d21]MDY7228118.1 hypothetical protein [Hyalangium sp. s54d21]
MSWSRWFPVLLGVLLLPGFVQVAEAGCTYSACTNTTAVDHTFSAGTRWTFNIQTCPCEGLVISSATFTPKGGTPRLVLNRGSIAEIHVPYLAGTPRFLDISESTSGLGPNAIPLTAAECAGGTLLAGNRVCKNIEHHDYAWKYFNTHQHSENVSVYMASQLGEYTYVNLWEFHDTGVIEPRLGLTGRLQIVSPGAGYAPYGGRMNPQSEATPLIGLSHMHNIYYRLDFDLAGAGNDAVEQLSFQPSNVASPNASCATPGQCAVNVVTPILTEAAQDFVPTAYTSWRVYDKLINNSDGRKIGYEIVPDVHGVWSGMTAGSEPWSSHEMFVTRFAGCESLAVGNVPPHIAPSCTSVPSHVSAMVNGQSVDGQDVVLWYVNRHLHKPRDEDQVNMPIEWMHFEIKPSSFHHKSPLEL